MMTAVKIKMTTLIQDSTILSKQSHFILHILFGLSYKQTKFDGVIVLNDKNSLGCNCARKREKPLKKNG